MEAGVSVFGNLLLTIMKQRVEKFGKDIWIDVTLLHDELHKGGCPYLSNVTAWNKIIKRELNELKKLKLVSNPEPGLWNLK